VTRPSVRTPLLPAVGTMLLVLAVVLPADAAADARVKVWQEPITLPTYGLLPPDSNPMFYKGESYQGAQKRIYPYPLADGITGIRKDATYTAVYLENEYVRLCVLPEIGGRLFSAVDKTNGYDFFYRQHVIKPALIGMLGAWISGGVEWCVFHHHRNTTHMPVDFAIRENPDGSGTVWIGETERRHRMRWTIALTLRPGRSYLEAAVTLRNRTPHAHSILYWANVAVHANDQYQVIFPPSVQVATYHSKNDFTFWPIGRGMYHGSDYTGVDLSWWKNHPKPVSCFAWGLREDFMGGYDHGKDAGVVHVGNHHIVCGAKLWEWAPGNVWDTKVLTDSDGPYAELMVGAFSDNQPDYSWIRPYEVKSFRQTWYPVRGIGGFKKANLHAALNLEVEGGKAVVGVHATSRRRGARVTLTAGDTVLVDEKAALAPDAPFTHTAAVPDGTAETDLEAVVRSAAGNVLIAYRPAAPEPVTELPEVVKPPPPPKEIETVEELYLTGLRIQQIHNPSIAPMDYYAEALRRDPGDARTNTIVGADLIRRGLYAEAETHLRRAIERITAAYTRPRDAEAFYLLGLALKARGQADAACDAFYRATWDAAQHAAAYVELAVLSARRGDFRAALEQVNRGLATNAENARAVALKAAVLRHLGRADRAEKTAARLAADDPLGFFALNELALAQAAAGRKDEAGRTFRTLADRMRGEVQSYLELAADYMDAGLLDEAVDVLRRQTDPAAGPPADYAMLYYLLGHLYERTRKPDLARAARARAARMPTDYGFPFRLEMIDVLESAVRAAPDDARAWCYLGNLLYELQPEQAIACWTRSRDIDPSEGLVHRNLGWARFRHDGDVPAAIVCYEKAVARSADPRYLLELDDLYERANTPPETRLAMLDRYPEVVAKRQPLLIRRIAVLVQTGHWAEALGPLRATQFHVAEGGGAELATAYIDAHLLSGLACLDAGQADKALDHFQAAGTFPENLSQETARSRDRMPQVTYCQASAHAALGHAQKAESLLAELAGEKIPKNWLQARYYQARALEKTGRRDKVEEVGRQLVAAASDRVAGKAKVDFFAKFGEQAARQARRADAHYALGLGLLLLGRTDEAKNQFTQAVQFNTAHTWARHELARLAPAKP